MLKEDFKNLNITEEEKRIITKINSRIYHLKEETQKLLGEQDDFNEPSIERAFLIKSLDENFTKFFKKEFDEIEKKTKKLSNSKDSLPQKQIFSFEKFKKNNIEKKKILKILKNSIENHESLFLWNSKTEIVEHLDEIKNSKKDNKKTKIFKEKIDSNFKELQKINNKEDFITIDSNIKEEEYLKEYKILSEKNYFLFFKRKIWKIIYFVLFFISITSLMIYLFV